MKFTDLIPLLITGPLAVCILLAATTWIGWLTALAVWAVGTPLLNMLLRDY